MIHLSNEPTSVVGQLSRCGIKIQGVGLFAFIAGKVGKMNGEAENRKSAGTETEPKTKMRKSEMKSLKIPLSGPRPSFPIRRRTIVNALTPEVEDECTTLAKALKDIPDRQRHAEELERRLESVSSETRALIDYMVRKEEDHKRYVNSLLRHIPEFIAEGRRPHDFSKDLLFCFITSLRFDCGIDTEDVVNLTAAEILNHYRQESHHPEWETQHNRECTRIDILEMAIDSLSRNVQRNDETSSR